MGTSVKIIVQDGSGEARDASGLVGESLMKALVSAGVEGIEAECGGECSCATCHVVLGEAWSSKIAPPGELERDMLDFASAERRPGSRLSCQVRLVPELDGVEVLVPEN